MVSVLEMTLSVSVWRCGVLMCAGVGASEALSEPAM
jgi:hypothetical protein